MSSRRKTGPAPRPLDHRKNEAAALRIWNTSPDWLADFKASLAAGLRACPSWPGVAADTDGQIWMVRRLPQSRTEFGYAMVSLSYTQQSAHRLVCAAWRGLPPAPDAWVLHHDGDATNNHWTNLEWGTPLENAADRRRHGTDTRPSANRGRRQATRTTGDSAGEEITSGPVTRDGTASHLLDLVYADPPTARYVPDGQGLFATEDGDLWQVWQPGSHTERCYSRIAITPHRQYPASTRLVRIHQLVADAHLGPRPAGLVTRHLDGDPGNNRVSNLAYGTMAENMEDRGRHGRTQRGADHALATLNDDEVAAIRARYAQGDRIVDIADDYEIGTGHVTHLAAGKYRKDAPGPISPLRGNPRGDDHPGAVIDAVKAAAIHADLLEKKRLAEEFSVGAIAGRLAVPPAAVRKAILNPRCISRMIVPETIQARLLVELAARQAARLDDYRDEAIAARHGVGVPLVQNIARGAWAHISGGGVALGCRFVPRGSSRTAADKGTISLVFKLLQEMQDTAEKLSHLTSMALAAKYGLTKSQVDDASSGKRTWEALPLEPDTLRALRAEIAEREHLRAGCPTRKMIALATGLSESFIKAVSAGHAWREEAALHGYKPRH